MADEALYNRTSRRDGIYSVRDFGAKGDGVTDDTDAIQAAVDAAPSHGTVFLPYGHHLLTRTIDCGQKAIRLVGCGMGEGGKPGGSVLIGSVNGPLYRFGYPAQHASVADLSCFNTHVTGIGLKVGGGNVAVERVSIRGHIGIYEDQNCFTLAIRNAKVVGVGQAVGSVGILLQGHASIHGADVVGFEHGIRACGTGNDIRAMRVEVNTVGLMLGMDAAGQTVALHGTVIGSLSCEANTVGIHVRHVTASAIQAATIQGSTNAPKGESDDGIVTDNISGVDVANLSISGRFATAAVRIRSNGLTKWSNVQASNSIGTAWAPVIATGHVFENCNRVAV